MEKDRDRSAEGIDPELLVALRVCGSSVLSCTATYTQQIIGKGTPGKSVQGEASGKHWKARGVGDFSPVIWS